MADHNQVVQLRHRLYGIDDYAFNIDRFLDASEFQKQLYSAFISHRNDMYSWKPSIEETFLEYQYECTRLWNDPHPEINFYEIYRNECMYNLQGRRYESDLIMAMVHATFLVMKEPPSHASLFFETYDSSYSSKSNPFQNAFDSFAKDFIEKNGQCDINFYATLAFALVLENIYDSDVWNDVTGNFEIPVIERITRHLNYSDQLTIYKYIKNAFLEYKPSAIENNLPF